MQVGCEDDGKIVEESIAPTELPQFIRSTLSEAEVQKVETYLDRLVEAGCRLPVLYLCLEELSPESAALRARRRRKWREDKHGERTLLPEWDKGRPLATRKQMETLRKNVAAVRSLIYRRQQELLLVADTGEVPLPSSMTTVSENMDDALLQVKESLGWICSLAEAYNPPLEDKLLKSKELIPLAAYVRRHADKGKAPGKRRAVRDEALEGLVELFCERGPSASDLREKLVKFQKEYRPYYKALVRTLGDLHRFHAPK